MEGLRFGASRPNAEHDVMLRIGEEGFRDGLAKAAVGAGDENDFHGESCRISGFSFQVFAWV